MILAVAGLRIPKTSPCLLCGLDYVPEYERDEETHRKTCAPHRAVLAAKPLKKLQSYAGRFYEVSGSGHPPRWALVYVQHCARLFTRELSLDSLAAPWDPDYRSITPLTAFIPVSDTGSMQGVAVVRTSSVFDPDSDPVLVWAWIVPSMRGQGVFTRVWNRLSERFGEFGIEGPYSEAMTNYLQHRGIRSERLCGIQDTLKPAFIRFVSGQLERCRPE